MAGPPRDLRHFLAELRARAELVEVEAEVDPVLEIPEIHRRVIAANGPALLFRRVKGSRHSLATNLFGSRERLLAAFGSRPLELVDALSRLPRELVPPTLGRLWRKRAFLGSLARVGTRRVARAAVLATAQRPPRLGSLPATQSWPRDGGRFLTLPLVYTQHPETGVSNLGIYRMQIFDDSTTGMHFQIGKGGGFHLAAAEERGVPLAANVFLGGPPALLLGALAPLPENVPEILFASLLLGERLRLARRPESSLPIVADAEFALVGEVAPRIRRAEGPFGDHYGSYSETHDYPVFSVRTLFAREDAIFPATVVGKPRQEDFYLGDFLQELLAPLISLAMPGVRALWSYGETGYHALAAAVVRERYAREAMTSAFRILGEGQLSLTKFLIALDRPVDLRDFKATLVHLLERTDPRTDLFLISHLAMDSLDYAGPAINRGSKGVWLGLGEPVRTLPRDFVGSPARPVRDVRVFAPGCLVLEGPPFGEDAACPARIASDPAFRDWPLVVLTDDAARAAKSTTNFLWTTFTRFDPARDVHAASSQVVHQHVALTPPILIDARVKPTYPPELFCDERTAETVARRWGEYFPSGMAMGDSDRGHLD